MPEFTVVDRRGLSRKTNSETSIVLARGASDVQRALELGKQGGVGADPAELRHAAQVRRNNEKFAQASGSGSGSSLQFATQRPLDPMFYWRETGMPYDVEDEEVLKELRKWCRFIYRSDPILASCIDVFSKYPVLGVSLQCKNEDLVEFYTELMFEDLGYEDYLIDIGREYWTVGEAWPMGYFDDTLGIWESDELLQPDDITVEKSPFLKDPRFFMTLPESIRRVLKDKQPTWEYEALIQSYPDLKGYATGVERKLPVSGSLLKQIKFTGDTFNDRGVPILLRALRPCIQEELLNAAQDAIASRFYTPLIHARIGASAQDLGTEQPWVPTRGDLENFLADMDAALAADFRVLATHFATEISSVFGRENMPNLDNDFARLVDRKLQVFGMSESMLSGAGAGETYAADAINRDLVSQLLSTYQRRLKRFMRSRMEVVAEAQHHYDYEEYNGRHKTIYEEVLVITEDGQRVVEEQEKLLVPDVQMASMSMRSETQRVQFIEALRATGVPISMQTRMRSMIQSGLDLDDEVERSRDEQVRLAVEEQKTRKATYIELKAQGLPVDPALEADFGPKIVNSDEIEQQQAIQQATAIPNAQMTANPAGPGAGPPGTLDPQADPNDPDQQDAGGEGPVRSPMLGVDDSTTPNLAPNAQELAAPPGMPLGMPAMGPGGGADQATIIQLPRNRSRPPESDEMRAEMPKPTGSLNTPGFLNDPPHLASRRRVRHRSATSPVVLDEREEQEG